MTDSQVQNVVRTSSALLVTTVLRVTVVPESR